MRGTFIIGTYQTFNYVILRKSRKYKIHAESFHLFVMRKYLMDTAISKNTTVSNIGVILRIFDVNPARLVATAAVC